MCLCRQTAVHIYKADQSPLANVLGGEILDPLRMIFYDPPPDVHRLELISCECVDAYLPVALIGGGPFALFAHLIAGGFLLGIAMGTELRRLVYIAMAWSLVTLAGIAYNFRQFSNNKDLLVDPEMIESLDRSLNSYLSAIPVQFAFNALLFLGIPAFILLALKRAGSRRKSTSNIRPA